MHDEVGGALFCCLLKSTFSNYLRPARPPTPAPQLPGRPLRLANPLVKPLRLLKQREVSPRAPPTMDPMHTWKRIPCTWAPETLVVGRGLLTKGKVGGDIEASLPLPWV